MSDPRESWTADEHGTLQAEPMQVRRVECSCGGVLEFVREILESGRVVSRRARFPHGCGAEFEIRTVTDIVQVPALVTPSSQERAERDFAVSHRTHRHTDGPTEFQHTHGTPDGWSDHDHPSLAVPGSRTSEQTIVVLPPAKFPHQHRRGNGESVEHDHATGWVEHHHAVDGLLWDTRIKPEGAA